MKIIEIKRHLDGRAEHFECELISMKPAEAIIRYVWHRDKPFRDGPIYLPAGDSITLAFYWEDRHFLIYKLMAADETLYGYRFDICEDVKIYSDKIIWADLIVDLWADPENKITVLDEEEVEAFKARGLLTPRQLVIIQSTTQYLLSHYQQLLAEIHHAVPQ